MSELSDARERLRALTSFEETLIVEAAAGTGKTAIIAGRITLMLAAGISPRAIAAITFTEFAASELAARVARYVADLLARQIPAPLKLALPDGLSPVQRANLEAAAGALDELMAATIHAFCQHMIASYAVEADLDPGAKLLDAVGAEGAFEQVFSSWLSRRLGDANAAEGDAIAVLSKADPRGVAAFLRNLARFRLEHRQAQALPADFTGRPDLALAAAVQSFATWYSAQPAEPRTEKLLDDLQELARFYESAFAERPSFEKLWALAHPPRLSSMRWNSAELLAPRVKGAWERAAGKQDGARLAAELDLHFADADRAYRVVSGRIAQALVSILSADLDEVLEDYRRFKREAALLDFDDLLECGLALVRNHDAVRRALGQRYRHILIDEFQDTDPIQSEIFFRIAAESEPDDWRQADLRPGALFLVGDPKQAIYRFRGADVATYQEARDAVLAIWPDNLVHVTANFRSRPQILAHVNRCFQAPLSSSGQPGYVALQPTLADADRDLPCAAKLAVETRPEARAEEFRRAEADTVAEACARLIGAFEVMDENGERVTLRAGHIALLAPTGTELWHYERALSERRLPFVSQAGRGLFRRQETQDLIALARTLADRRDTLAFGALMRGPLIGLTEEELLDITAALSPTRAGAPQFFSISTDPEHVSNAKAKRALVMLRGLHSRARSKTPLLILAEAVEMLGVRAILAGRGGERSARAWANVEAFLERARPYGVAGMKAFARDITRAWQANTPADEGRVDAEGDAIEIVTMHSAKGLEWPVVIPINTATRIRSPGEFVHRLSDNTLHWVIGEAAPPELMAARVSEEESMRRERERLWYVACTRAKELLLVPHAENADRNSWARIVNLELADLPEWPVNRFERFTPEPQAQPQNLQTPAVFAEEKAIIDRAARPTQWLNPSRHDDDRIPIAEAITGEETDAPLAPATVGAGRVRGLVLHKLMEEVLTGEIGEEQSGLCTRANELITQLIDEAAEGAVLPKAEEMAATIASTLALPDIAALRPRLVPELSIYARLDETTALSARADAIAFENGKAEVIIDWKSDAAPDETTISEHTRQLSAYLAGTGAGRGALVYMTTGAVRWVTSAAAHAR